MSENNQSNNTPYIVLGVVVILAIIGTAVYMNMNKPADNAMSKPADNNAMMQDNKKPEDKMMAEKTVMVGGAAMYPSKDIVSNVVNAPNLTTLVTAVKAADLVATLQGPGPFTVFGPDNAAFAKLPAGTVETLVKPENKAKLAGILTYHVVAGKYDVAALSDGQQLKTVQGEMLTVKKSAGKVMIMDDSGNTATVTTPDVYQSNGVAHVIDTVLMPSGKADAMMQNDKMMADKTVMVGGAAMFPTKDIVSNVVNAPNLTTLVTAVKAAGLVETLQGAGPFTVFAPDNDAFAKLPAGTVETLVKPENKATLTGILTYHVVAGKYDVASLKDGQKLKTVQGEELTIKKSGTTVMIMDASGNTAKIVTPDVYQSNGVAHVIDTVLMPKK
jgi:uncharacterized surface protein with fasciclin (FAS1) repeats